MAGPSGKREPERIAVGESFEVDAWVFEVVDLDGRRIDKVLARPGLPATAAA